MITLFNSLLIKDSFHSEGQVNMTRNNRYRITKHRALVEGSQLQEYNICINYISSYEDS